MPDNAVSSKLKVQITGDTKSAEQSLVSLRDRIREVKEAAGSSAALPDFSLFAKQIQAGLNPLTNFKKALADTLATGKLAGNVNFAQGAKGVSETLVQIEKLAVAEKNAGTQATSLAKQLQALGRSFPDLGLIKKQVQAGILTTGDLKKALAETISIGTRANALQYSPVSAKKVADAIIQLRKLRDEEAKAIAAQRARPTTDLFPDIGLVQKQVSAGLKSVNDLKRALAETIGQAKLANRVQYSPVNDEKIAKAIIQLKEIRAAEEAAGKEAITLSQRLSQAGDALQRGFIPLAAAVGGLVFALKSVSAAGQEFDKNLRLISTISKDSGKSVQTLGDNLQEAAVQLQTDPIELAAAQYEILSSGITDTSQAFEVLTQAAKLAKTGVASNAEAADILTSSINALGGTPARNAEILFKTVEIGKVKVGELGESFGNVASQAAVANVSLEEISAAIATLSLNGKSAEEGLTGIRSILTAVSKQGTESVKFAKQIGLEFNTSAIRAKGFAGFIKDIQDKTKGSDEAIAKLFGRVEGINTVLALGGIQAQQYAQSLEEIKNSTGSLDDAFNRTKSPIDGLISSITALRIEIGERLNTAFEGPINKLSELLNALRGNKDLLTFAISLTAVTVAVGSLVVALTGLAKVFAPFIPLVEGVGAALSLEFAPALAVTLGGVLALVATATAVARWAESFKQAHVLAQRSIEDMNKELDASSSKLVIDSRNALQTAKQYDQLAAKVNKTAQEKIKLKKEFTAFEKILPNFAGSLAAVTNGYRSMEDAIRNATAAQIAFTERSNVEEELKRIQDARDSLLQFNPFGPDGKRLVTTSQQDQIAALDAQREAALKRLGNIAETTKKRLKELYPSQNQKQPVPDSSLKIQDDEDIKKVLNARESLLKEIEKIEVDQTNFQQGEFAKRRAVIEKDYADQMRRIKKLATEAKKSGTAEVIDATRVAAENKVEALKRVDIEESIYQQRTLQRLKELKTSIQKIDAESTIGNPFDDLLAQAQEAQNAIEKTRDDARAALIEEAQNDPTKRGQYFREQLATINEVYKKDSAANAQRLVDARDQEIVNLKNIRRDTQVIRAEIMGDNLALLREESAQAVAELSDRLKREQKLLDAAATDKNLQASDEGLRNNALAGLNLLKSQVEKTQAQIAKVQSDTQQREAQIQQQNAKVIVDSIQEQINLLGERPELINQLVKANEEYMKQLELEAKLTSTTAARRKEIETAILTTKINNASIQANSDDISQALDTISSKKFENGSIGSAVNSLATNLKSARIEYLKFKEAAKANGSNGSLSSFIFGASGDQKLNFANIANSAVDAFAAAFGSSDNKFAQAFSNVIGVITAAKSNPALAAISAPLMGLQAAAKETGGFLKKYAAFIDPLGFRKLFSGGSKSALQKAQENLEKAQKFTSNILNNVDTNDLTSLTTALQQVLRFKSGGGAAFDVKKQAYNQLKDAIEERKKTIAAAIKDITFQNSAIEKALAKLESTPLANLTIDRQIALDSLIKDRDTQLDQYKDSLETQLLIEKNFQLNRQALFKQSAQDIIDAVIEEQSTIASLRADTNLNQAKTNGTAIDVINASLQAQLVAIENDIAAFKGAEEEKTEFLKSKTAERNQIIKEANDQVQDLLNAGLDILNEGLVTSETKAESQKRRLTSLFGSALNPFGNITDTGSLVQSNVTIGPGGIQINLNAIADAQSLIAQINDPVVQAALIAALNSALSRVNT
jgi:TP901 family phage tail tape measure protein